MMWISRPLLMGHNLRKKGDELFAGVPLGSLADDLARLGVQCRIQRQSPVTVIFKTVPFCAAG